jgi:hypothetical protein
MEDKRKKTQKLCYLCGKPGADTVDHIPPKGIFPKKPAGRLITVPAHHLCNHGFHKDDELFRNLIIMASWRTLEGRKAWKEQVVPSWQKNPGAKEELRSRLTNVWAKDKISGALIRAKGIKIECSFVERQIDRWTRGLFYHRFKKPMPPDLKVEVDKLNPPEESIAPMISDLAQQGIRLKWIHVEPDVFSYAYPVAEESIHIGFAVFVFFNTEVYLGSTGLEFE